MDANELPDNREEMPPDQLPKNGKSPLKDEKVAVVRFNRKRLLITAGVLFAITAISCILALSPRKKLSAQEISEQGAKNDPADAKLNLPEKVAAAADNYGEVRAAATVVQPPGNDPERDSLERGDAAGITDEPTGSRESMVQQMTRVRADQRQKDSISATRAPLTFAGGNAARQETAPVREAAMNLPDMGGVNRMIDNLSAGQGPAGPEDQNQQSEKRRFSEEKRNDFPYLRTTLLTPISPYEVKAGTILPGVLITGINSDLPGQIVAQARENVFDTVSGRYLLIPLGSRYIGEYDSKISYGQARALVVWTRIVMPNGNSISLENMPGIDLSGYAGVTGQVNNHYGKLLAGVVLGSVLGAGAQVAVGGQGAPNVPPTFAQLLVSGAAGNVNQAGQRITEKNLNLQPTIEVAPGQKINIFVTKDMILKPYAD